MKIRDITEERWFQQTALVITILGALMVIYVSFLLLYTSNPLTVVQPFKVITYSTGQGGSIHFEMEYCSDKDSFQIFNRQLENINTGDLWDVPDQVIHLSKGCSKEMRDVPLPTRIDVGTYKLRMTVNIKINSVRTEKFEYTSESFQVGAY